MKLPSMVLFLATAPSLTGCTLLGPASIANGRAVYNEVINKTEDEQLLNMIVRERYDETSGMLAVASVTASISTRAKVGGQFGIGPDDSYDTNLVPLSVGFAYEENPTISYIPLGGEVFQYRALAPVSLEHAFLMARASEDRLSIFSFLIRRINGLRGPCGDRWTQSPKFARLADVYSKLQGRGALDFVRSESGDDYFVTVHDYSGLEDSVRSFMELLGLRERELDGKPISFPVRLAIGSNPDQLNIETRSVLDLIRSIGRAIDIPREHLDAGVVENMEKAKGASVDFMSIRSSPSYPEKATVAIRYRGYWFYIDATDSRSKRGFSMIRTLIGIRLSDADVMKRGPALTIPVR